ncbi:unnamed protein product [Clonostachys rhizophaga]|uniref:Peptidase A1 domain-containing protein n=1 Tax=Clonostachys rhizophaga TaxID=160324 RepID=A0A9N9V9C0_9HYPO|nr:unnamed protein product [Clonostachys rhizophaga]
MQWAYLLGLVAAATAGHVSIPFSRQDYSTSAALVKRQAAKDITLEALNNLTGGGYYSEFSIGTPPQKVSFLLDTGSSDTWVNSVDADVCNNKQLQARIGTCLATFNQSNSSTYQLVSSDGFDIKYLDNTEISGDYFNDTVHLGSVSIKNQQLGLALQSVRPTGIMGLGLSANVATREKYKTIVDNLVDQGFIDRAAFSLYLNDLESDSGTVLFGAIDQKKFIGNLTVLPLTSQTTGAQVTSFNVRLLGFDLLNPDGTNILDLSNLNANTILDSGSTISLLPDKQVQQIWKEFGVISIKGILSPFVDCAYRGSRGDGYIFEFRFNGKTIQVPMHEMVIDAYADVQEVFQDPSVARYFRDWDRVCIFGISSTLGFNVPSTFTLLGASFLRSAYVVYDLTNEQLAIGQANLNSTDSDIVEIKSGIAIPSVTGVASQTSNALPTRTSSATQTTSTSQSTESSAPDNNNASSRTLSSPPLAAIMALLCLGVAPFAL